MFGSSLNRLRMHWIESLDEIERKTRSNVKKTEPHHWLTLVVELNRVITRSIDSIWLIDWLNGSEVHLRKRCPGWAYTRWGWPGRHDKRSKRSRLTSSSVRKRMFRKDTCGTRCFASESRHEQRPIRERTARKRRTRWPQLTAFRTTLRTQRT